MRPEVELLLCCADTSIDTAGAERIKVLLRTDLDWASLLQTAGRHGVMPLLSRSLRAVSPEDAPPTILAELRYHSRANAARTLFLTDGLLKLLKLLEAHVIPALPYKGPILAASIYGNLALREFFDLDILVHERDYQRAQRLLSTSAYRLIEAFENESTYVDSNGTVAVDLHKRMTSREFPSPLQFEHLWERRHHTVLLGTKVPSLSPEDTLLMLAIQISKDAGSRYFQLVKLCDMAALLRASPSLDLAQSLFYARQGGGERMLLFSLALVNDLLGVRMPQACLRAIRSHPSIGRLVEAAQRQLFQNEAPVVAERRTVETFRWHVRERLRDKLHPYYLRYIYNAFAPCNLDRQLVPLPRRLAFLYYGIRPMRLVCKYGSLLLRGRL
ncbi:MAG: nucleotidyltransferase family protein [Nitrospira sp. BO4]|jgi:hypothetical protein|nr:nucleotidyltransferase family protein [Nitrospira sp. BO4]